MDGKPDLAELESLTLAQLAGQFLRQPRRTLAGLRRIVNEAPEAPPTVGPAMVPGTERPRSPARAGPGRAEVALLLKLLALALVLWGCHVLAANPAPADQSRLAWGGALALPGMALWLAADLLHPWPSEASKERLPEAAPLLASRRLFHRKRRTAALLAALCSVLAWRFTAGNSFTLVGTAAWLGSVALWLYALQPSTPALRDAWDRLAGALQRPRLQRRKWLALLLIVALAAGMRLDRLDEVMPEMTSDHVEKIRDAWRVSQGEFNVFFANIGGREPLQMYAMAALAQAPGLGFNFYTLKFLSALEGVVAVLLVALAARSVIGGRAGRLAAWLTGALVAVSYWHLILSRMGLRIVLTTAVASLLLLLLYRALRHNRRGDFLAAGLVTGFGLYTYQATRLLPLVVLTGAALALVRYPSGQRPALLRNLAALVLVAFAAFVPLGGYSLEFPQDFWRRTTSRVLGDQAAQGDGSDTPVETASAASAILTQLGENLRNALLMFNWKGDVAWINGAPGRPALDPWTGALFLTGLVAWLRRLQRQRSVLAALLPVSLFLLLLPSALALSFPLENPSHTRASAALSLTFMIAVLPLAQLVDELRLRLRGRRGQMGAGALALIFVAGAMHTGQRRYFEENLHFWQQATFHYSTAGQVLAAFVEVYDAPGNAFVIAWPHWWDHRAVGIEAGLMEWPNGIHDGGRISAALSAALARQGPYRLRPEAGLLFFLSPADGDSLAALQGLFPNGLLEERRSELERHEFLIYRVAPPGAEALQRLLEENR